MMVGIIDYRQVNLKDIYNSIIAVDCMVPSIKSPNPAAPVSLTIVRFSIFKGQKRLSLVSI